MITDGPMIGRESQIKRIDRHKMIAIVEIELMGAKREMKLGLEIIKKISTQSPIV